MKQLLVFENESLALPAYIMDLYQSRYSDFWKPDSQETDCGVTKQKIKKYEKKKVIRKEKKKKTLKEEEKRKK